MRFIIKPIYCLCPKFNRSSQLRYRKYFFAFFTSMFIFFPVLAFAVQSEQKMACGLKTKMTPIQFSSYVRSLVVQATKEETGDISIIDASLASAQSMLETGWGSSYAAIKRNNLFGLTNPGGRTMKFHSCFEGAKIYVKSLVSHPAYEQYRQSVRVRDPVAVRLRYLSLSYSENPDYPRYVQYILAKIKRESPILAS